MPIGGYYYSSFVPGLNDKIDKATLAKYPGIIVDSSGWYRARANVEKKFRRGV
jgi:hypothetical protein